MALGAWGSGLGAKSKAPAGKAESRKQKLAWLRVGRGVSPSLFRVRVAFVADDVRKQILTFPISLPSPPRYLAGYDG